MIGVAKSDAGRRTMFLRLMSEYQAALRRLAAAYARDLTDQEDMVQEIAIALWRAIPQFRGEASERTWLYRIAHNTAITAVTKLRRRGRTESALEDAPESAVAIKDRSDDRLIEQQKRELLMRALRELSAADRQVVALHLENLSHREIQEITGISEGAIATRLSRIRDRLSSKIREMEASQR
jgi:RNA polymerase sigma-70 factor (ECF subfamily)